MIYLLLLRKRNWYVYINPICDDVSLTTFEVLGLGFNFLIKY